jgi:hypothetical protein
MPPRGYYFHIPRGYADYLGGLRWSPTGEAVEYADGETFAFRHAIGLFLEGFGAGGPLIHFGHILHLLHLLGLGRGTLPGPAWVLCRAFMEAARPLRNAGVFCAVLCRRVPPVAEAVDAAQVCGELLGSAVPSILYVSWANDLPESTAELPPLGPATFEAHVLQALEAYTFEEVTDWLRHGRGPVKGSGERLAREIVALKPRSLAAVLANLTQRPRLAGAVPFVA